MTLRWPLTPHVLMYHVWLYPRIIVSNSHGNTYKYVDTVTILKNKKTKTKTNGQWPQDDLWPHFCWGHMCDSTQGSLYPSSMKIHQSIWIQWPFFQKKKNLNQRSLTPRWPLTPRLIGSHVWLCPRIIVSKSHESTSKVCGYSDPFFKNLNQRSLTPRWPLTPCLLRSHVWLYPRIIVSKSHTSMYADTVINFAKYHIHTTYCIQNEWSLSLFLNTVQARQKL